jgi:hypothetical protein
MPAAVQKTIQDKLGGGTITETTKEMKKTLIGVGKENDKEHKD